MDIYYSAEHPGVASGVFCSTHSQEEADNIARLFQQHLAQCNQEQT